MFFFWEKKQRDIDNDQLQKFFLMQSNVCGFNCKLLLRLAFTDESAMAIKILRFDSWSIYQIWNVYFIALNL